MNARRGGRADQDVHQVGQLGRGIIGQAAVHGRDLHDGAAWRDHPVKAFRQGQLGQRTDRRVARAQRGEEIQMALDGGQVDLGEQLQQARRVQRDLRPQVALAGQCRTTPALTNSSRSTRGTTRMTA